MSWSGIIYSLRNGGVSTRFPGENPFPRAEPARRWHTFGVRRTPVLFAAFIAAAATAAGGVGAESTQARLRVVDTDPVTVRATGFRAYEHARISVLAGARLLHRAATAGSGGGFTMRLAGVDANTCAGFSVTASGDRGSRATYKRAPGVCPVLLP
jgi:hypothetical protein